MTVHNYAPIENLGLKLADFVRHGSVRTRPKVLVGLSPPSPISDPPSTQGHFAKIYPTEVKLLELVCRGISPRDKNWQIPSWKKSAG